MSKSVKMLLAGAAIMALSASAFARGGEDCGSGEYGPMARNPERMEKMREQHLSVLREKLKLTAKQEAAWNAYVASQPKPGRAARPDPAEMEKLNAPQRVEKNLERMRAMETKMAEHLTALKAFYAVLTPEQQKTFDDQMPRFGDRHGPRGGRK